MGLPNLTIFYFDSIGVPSLEEMERGYGGAEEWQQVMTAEWVRRMKVGVADVSVVLDAKTRPSFIAAACEAEGISEYETLLVDCSDEVRRERLARRGQSELASERMLNWARYLRNACAGGACTIIDNSALTAEETAEMLLHEIRQSRASS